MLKLQNEEKVNQEAMHNEIRSGIRDILKYKPEMIVVQGVDKHMYLGIVKVKNDHEAVSDILDVFKSFTYSYMNEEDIVVEEPMNIEGVSKAKTRDGISDAIVVESGMGDRYFIMDATDFII